MNAAPQLTLDLAATFDNSVAPVLASPEFAALCKSKGPDILPRVVALAEQLRDSWDPSISASAWCHALALKVAAERRQARRVFERQVIPMRANLYGAAMRLTLDPADADDLVQDTMVRAWRFWDSFEQGTGLKAWLFTILRNTFINGYHRRGRKRDFQNDVSQQMRSLGSMVAVGNSHSQPPGPEEVVCAASTRLTVHEALAALPTDYRLAVSYRDLDGLSYREIAEVMACPVGTVMSRIHRGRKLLHKLLYDHAQEVGLATDRGPVDNGQDSPPALSLIEETEPEYAAVADEVRDIGQRPAGRPRRQRLVIDDEEALRSLRIYIAHADIDGLARVEARVMELAARGFDSPRRIWERRLSIVCGTGVVS